ncbi:MAG: heme ABC exporter ATP-binding protein CcmA [Pseudomonadota bacterium]
MLSLQSLSFIAQDQKIFQDISLTLFPSSIIYLKGKNGSGKTSLLRMLAGIQKPTSGDITYGKESIPINKFDKPFCTYIGHKTGLKQELSVIDNLKYWAQLYNAEELVDAAIIYFQLQEHAYKKCYELSAGNQKKVALAKLITCQSKFWLLDEVDTNLDDANKKLLINLIVSQADSGGIVFISSHHEPEIKTALTINMSDYV